jgi:hypothetical protein
MVVQHAAVSNIPGQSDPWLSKVFGPPAPMSAGLYKAGQEVLDTPGAKKDFFKAHSTQVVAL